LKIGVPWPTKSESQQRVFESLILWRNSKDLVVCLPEPCKHIVKAIEHEVMPRNTSDIGSNCPRVYVKDVLGTLREKYPNEDWYGICNSDCVLTDYSLKGFEDYEVLVYHRTDIPDWRYCHPDNAGSVPKVVQDRILYMREQGMTDKQIARKFNRASVPPPSGHQEWTYVNMRELFFDMGLVYFWGQDMFLFRNNIVDRLFEEYLNIYDPVLGTGGFDQRLNKWCMDNFKTTRVLNKLYHVAHTSEWTTDDVEYLHNGGDLTQNEATDNAKKMFFKGGEISNWRPHIVENPLTFIHTEKMVEATKLLASLVPPDTDAIMGVARSGLIAASQLACDLHLPLMSVSPSAGVIDMGSGARFKEQVENPKKIWVIDDTIFRGTTYKKVMPILISEFPRTAFIKSAVYSTPQSKHLVDYFACELAEPHYLEWNFFNSGPGERAAYDMDGVLCRDIAAEDDDDGPRYINALKNAIPRYLPRRSPISMIVTARLERYRSITEEWLEKYGVRCDKLIMGSWKSLAERNKPNTVATYKSDIYKQSKEQLFVESCPIQAKEIARQTGKKVLCPDAGRVFS